MYEPLSPLQSREYANSVQLENSLRMLKHEQRSNRGSMVWMSQRGKDYLMRSYYNDRGKRAQRSLGPRSEATEAMLARFQADRARIEEKAKALALRSSEQAALNRATGLARMPEISARILRAFGRAGFNAPRFSIVGTHALYVYEMLAAVHFSPELTTTMDMDVLVDPRAPLRLLVEGDCDDAKLIDVLRMADRSFQVRREGFRAENRDGFLVDFIKPQRRNPWNVESMDSRESDIAAAMMDGLAWLESAPKVEAVCVDTRGGLATIHAPDPRVFAVHKHWLSSRPGREPFKARRDRAQAFAVARLIEVEIPHLTFDADALRMVPRGVIDEAFRFFSGPGPR